MFSKKLMVKSLVVSLWVIFIYMLAVPIFAQSPETKEEIKKLQTVIKEKGYTFSVGPTTVADIPLKVLCGLREPVDWRKKGNFDEGLEIKLLGLPLSFDWRIRPGYVTSIKDQGICGACWAFATIGSYEGAIAVAFGSTVPLSEKYLLDCNTKGYDCIGGWFDFDDILGGAPKQACYPYNPIKAACKTTCPKFNPIFKWYYVGTSYGIPTVDEIKNAIYVYGPVAVAICADNYFKFYTGGIFNNCNSGQVNHAVVLIGWNDSGKYWLLKNSWGTGWGENGYMRIQYGCSKVGYAAVYGIPRKANFYKIPEQSTSVGPGVGVFNSKLYCIYKANDSSNALKVTNTSDGMNWSSPYQIQGQSTSAVPGLAVFTGKLYCIYRADDSSNVIRVTNTSDGLNWSSSYPIQGQSTSAGPALAVFNNKLYCIYKANDLTNVIRVTSTSDGLNWSSSSPIQGQSTSARPVVAVFNNKLYCIYKANDASNALKVTNTSDGVNWSSPYSIQGQSTSAGPAATAFNNKLYCIYRANDSSNALKVTSTTDGINWGPSYSLQGQSTSAVPGLVVFNNKLYCIYKANDLSNAILVTTITQ